MDFRRLSHEDAYPFYRALDTHACESVPAFESFRLFTRKLQRGDFLLLRNRFQLEVFGLFQGRAPRILATHYQSRTPGWGEPHSLGTFAIAPDISEAELQAFHHRVIDALGSAASQTVAPLNGHFALGLSIPDPGTDPQALGFLTAVGTPALSRYLHSEARFSRLRSYRALKLSWTPELEARLRSEIRERPAAISTRQLRLRDFKNEVALYNQLVNSCMVDHPRFHPLSEEENWNLMRASAPLICPEYFRFLLHEGKEVGFVFGIPDYNPILRPGRPDPVNFAAALWYKRRVRRARVIYSCILPEHRGSRIFKFVRHEVLLSMFRNGIREIESSYIDSANDASLGNVRSAGARESHFFSLYSLCKEPLQGG